MAHGDPLEARIQALEDLEAIKQLKHAYFRCLDMRLWDELRGYFTPDASVDYGGQYRFEGADTILRFAGHLRTLLEAAVAEPERNVWTLPLIGEGEQARQLEAWSRGPAVPAGSPLLHRLVEEQALRTPDAIAVEAGSVRLTYAELVEQARRVAEGVSPGAIVALAAERTPELIVQMLGVLQAGAAYLPIDPAYPAERRVFMVDDSGAKDIKDFKDSNDNAPRTAG